MNKIYQIVPIFIYFVIGHSFEFFRTGIDSEVNKESSIL